MQRLLAEFLYEEITDQIFNDFEENYNNFTNKEETVLNTADFIYDTLIGIGNAGLAYTPGSPVGIGTFSPYFFTGDFINNFNSATVVDPLILDLDGDGVETTALADGAYFDMDENGFAETTAWVGEDDGLLANDKYETKLVA